MIGVMLPGPVDGAVSLADVLRDSLTAVRSGGAGGADGTQGASSRLRLTPVDRAAVVLIDGLGAENLRARAGHARTLAGAMATRADIIATGVPTTTAAALATLTTGVGPGVHGLVGYSALDPVADRVVNQLRGWDDGALPQSWQRAETVFERATAAGLEAIVFGSERYRDSGFTNAVLRGARYVPGKTVEDRIDALGDALADRSWRGIAYAYLAELDMAATIAAGSPMPGWPRSSTSTRRSVGSSAGSARRPGSSSPRTTAWSTSRGMVGSRSRTAPSSGPASGSSPGSTGWSTCTPIPASTPRSSPPAGRRPRATARGSRRVRRPSRRAGSGRSIPRCCHASGTCSSPRGRRSPTTRRRRVQERPGDGRPARLLDGRGDSGAAAAVRRLHLSATIVFRRIGPARPL